MPFTGALDVAPGDGDQPGHRSADRSLLYPSVARSVVGGLVAIAVILSGIVAINIIQRDDPSPSVPAARKSTSASASESAAASAAAKSGSATASAKAKPSVAAAPKPSATASAPAVAPATPAENAPTAAEAAALRIPLTVLNNSRINGLATAAAADFRADGWTVVRITGTTYQPKVTTVYFLAGQERSAQQLMRDEPRVRRMLLRPRSLPGKGLTVVVTREYAGQ